MTDPIPAPAEQVAARLDALAECLSIAPHHRAQIRAAAADVRRLLVHVGDLYYTTPDGHTEFHYDRPNHNGAAVWDYVDSMPWVRGTGHMTDACYGPLSVYALGPKPEGRR
jgi:hypothetical protein